MDRTAVKALVLERIPDADIRIEQRDEIRIFWRGRYAVIREPDGYGIEVSVFLKNGPDDDPIEAAIPRIVDRGFNEQEAAWKLIVWLRRVVHADW